MKNNLQHLHCGACQENFDNIEKLDKHLKECPEAKYLLPLIHIVSFGNDGMGHPLGGFLWCFQKAIKLNLIKRYAYAVADDLNTLERAGLHRELCEVLELNYKMFRPFESSEIKELMNRKQALNYLCYAIYKEAHKLVEKKGLTNA